MTTDRDPLAGDTVPDGAPGQQGGPTDATPPEPTGRSKADTKQALRSSRTSGVWAAVVALVVVLVVLVIFIIQNTQSVEVSFLGWTGTAPLAAALLIALAGGLLLAAVTGTLRILQLRRRVRRLSR